MTAIPRTEGMSGECACHDGGRGIAWEGGAYKSLIGNPSETSRSPSAPFIPPTTTRPKPERPTHPKGPWLLLSSIRHNHQATKFMEDQLSEMLCCQFRPVPTGGAQIRIRAMTRDAPFSNPTHTGEQKACLPCHDGHLDDSLSCSISATLGWCHFGCWHVFR